MGTRSRLYRSLILCEFMGSIGEAILLGSMSLPGILDRRPYQDTQNLKGPEHLEQVTVFLAVHMYTSLSIVVCLKEHQVNFGLVLLQILSKICTMPIFIVPN